MIDRFERFPGVLRACTAGLSDADARWRSESGAWSIVEVVAHIADEETLDFGTRVRMTLEDPSATWPGIDPERRAVEMRYRERVLVEEIERFCADRAESVEYLRGLGDSAPWGNTYTHPTFGEFHAGDILSSWCAHDWLHLRQIAKRLYEMTNRDAGEFETRYAGEWGV